MAWKTPGLPLQNHTCTGKNQHTSRRTIITKRSGYHRRRQRTSTHSGVRIPEHLWRQLGRITGTTHCGCTTPPQGNDRMMGGTIANPHNTRTGTSRMEEHRHWQIHNPTRWRNSERDCRKLAQQEQTPQKRQNHTKNTMAIPLAGSATMARTIHQRMHHLSTKQEPYPPTTNPTLQNTSSRKCTTLHTDCNGPHYRTTQEQGIWQHSHDSWSWMHTRCNLPTIDL